MRSVLAPAPHPEPTSRLNSVMREDSSLRNRLPLTRVTKRERSVQFYPKISTGWTER